MQPYATALSPGVEDEMKHGWFPVMVLLVIAPRTVVAQGTVKLTVDEAVERALAHGLEMAEARAEVDAAEADHWAAKALYGPRVIVEGRALYFNERPTIDLDLGMDTTGSPLWMQQAIGSILPNGPMEAGEQYNVDLRVTLAQPLTKLEAISELSDIKGIEVEVARVQEEKAAADLAYQVREAAYQLLKIRDGISALEETEREVLARQKQVEAFRTAELVGPQEVLEVGVKLAELRQGLIKTRAYETVAASRLRILLRLDPDASLEVAAPEAPTAMPALRECVESAHGHRPEVAELRLRVEQARAGVRAKLQEFTPDVNLVAVYQYQAGTSIGQPELAAGAVLNWTPFAWGETYYAAKHLQAKLRRGQLALERVEALIGLDVERAYAEAEAARQAIEVAAAQVTQAEELCRIEQARFEVHDNTATDLLAAQTSLLRARNALTGARYDYLIALADLQRATGQR
jgi:outer membrane protein TolC